MPITRQAFLTSGLMSFIGGLFANHTLKVVVNETQWIRALAKSILLTQLIY